jgi:hypothetical protein
LNNSGIDAYVTEDNSLAGIWLGGTIAEIHKPQVWIERADIDRAKPVLDDFEQKRGYHPEKQTTVIDVPFEMTCDECGERLSFPAEQRGTVQECPKCTAYIDVGSIDEDWDDTPIDEESEADDN